MCLITSDRALKLRLQVGAAAYALISPSAVVLMTQGIEAFKFSARNQLTGSIRQIRLGSESAEVAIALKGGDSLLAIVANEAVGELERAEGKAVSAIFKASSVILGVAA